MGCDYYADENGRLRIEFRLYLASGDETIAVVDVEGLDPHEPIAREVTHGDDR